MQLGQSQYSFSGDPSNPDHVYVDATFYNDSYNNPSLPQYIPAQISQTRDSPFINNPALYNMAITRFSISSDYPARVYQGFTGATGTQLWASLSYNEFITIRWSACQ